MTVSDKKRRYQKPDIRFHDQPHNTDGMAFLGIKLDSIDVSEWHPLPDGQGKPTQVHVSMMIEGGGRSASHAFQGAWDVGRFHIRTGCSPLPYLARPGLHRQ